MSKSEQTQRISLREVAQRAGVSIGTASNVFSGKVWVSPETREQVLSTAAQLGYVPRSRPEADTNGERSITVGYIVRNTPIPLASNPYYGPILHGAERACSAAGINLMYAVADEQLTSLNELPVMIQRKEVQGLLVVDYFQPAFFSLLQEQGIPFVLLEHTLKAAETDTVIIDDEQGGYQATQYLLQMGHRSPPPAMIAASPRLLSVARRLKGYHQALKEWNLEVPADYVRYGDLNVGGGHREMNALLDLSQPPSAVFCSNDLTAIGALNALQERGIKVPEQCSVVGYDDIEMAAQLIPPLTTIKSETELLGMQGVWHLLERLKHPFLAPRHTILRAKLVERRSVARKIPSD